ncbi:MAG: hypothetical protein IKO61_01435 [Lachnospiraceae bacterium]|nr:hypothetical protein [Lachnospiraceae bacterium]
MKRFTSFCVSAAMVIAAWPGAALPARAAQAESGYITEIEVDAPLPVGGWSDHEEILVEDYEAPETDGEVYESRRVLNASMDNFFLKSVGTYGRNSLSTEQKAFYDKIDEAATEFMESYINLSPTTVALVGGTSADYYVVKKITKDSGSSLTVDQMVQALYAFDYDHPAYYWLSNGYLSGSDNISLLTYEEYSQVSDRATINRAIVNGAKAIIEKAELGEDTLDKIAIVHDQIIDKIDYAYEADGVTPISDKWAHSVQGVFDGHNAAVCEGYTDTFAMIMNYMGIANCYVVGTATNDGNGGGGGHAWNLVSEDGSNYYYMDLTWDDYGNGVHSYTYFGMPKTDFESSHTAYTPAGVRSKWLYSLPANISDSFDGLYYSRAGYYYDYDGGADATAFAKRLVTRSKRFGSVVAFMGKPVFDKVAPVYKAYGLTTVYHSSVTCKGQSYWLCTMNVGNVDISGATVTLPQTTYEHTGSAITPEPEVICNGVKLIEGLNYTVSYADNTEAGNATVTVTGCGNFTGSSSSEFTIEKAETVPDVKSIEDVDIYLSPKATDTKWIYDGTVKSPQITVKDDIWVLDENKDYTVTHDNSVDAGDYQVTVTGIGNYSGSMSFTYTIVPAALYSSWITLEDASYTYDGTEKKPAVTVNTGKAALVEGKDYTVSYQDNVAAGNRTAKVIIQGIGNYTEKVTKSFTIEPGSTVDEELTIVTVPVASAITYGDMLSASALTGGSAKLGETSVAGRFTWKKPSTVPTVADSNKTEYDVVFTPSVSGTDKTATCKVKLAVSPKKITSDNMTLSATTFKYDGTEKKPTVVVKDGTKTVSSSEYTVTYKNNVEAGTATVTVTDNEGGNYSVSGVLTFEIEKETEPVHVHTLIGHVGVEASCTKDGTKAYWECSECKKLFAEAEGKTEITLADTVVKAEGHKLIHIEAAASTLSEEGNKEYWVCQKCFKYFSDAEGKNEMTEAETKIAMLKNIEDCKVSGLSAKAWTGSAIRPEITVKDGEEVLIKDTDYTVSYSNNTNVGKASVIITGKGAYGGTLKKSFVIKKVSLKYRAYVQKKNWMSWSEALVSGTKASTMAGTTDNLRMETIQMQLSGVTGAVKYRAYVEKMGWTQWATTADTTTFAGTKGMSRRVEMIQLQASGQVATLYDMYYRAYSEKFGWLGWAKSGAKAGSAGYARKLEAFQVNFVRKGEDFSLTSPRAKCFYDKSKDGANPK